MKKFSRFLIALLITLSTIQVVPIRAESVPENTYPMEQNEKNFEVALVENSGTFNYLAAFDTFEEAKAYMKESGDNAVVRAKDSNKQTKIIAMNSGTAYSCRWTDAGTVSLNGVGNNVTGYMSSYRQISYLDTESYRGDGHGNVKANLGGFECYVDLAVVELIPYVYVDQGIAVCLADDLKVIPKISSYTVVQNGNYRDLVFTAYSIFEKNGGTAPIAVNTAVGPAADWMVTGRTYYSVDDVTFYNDRNMTDPAGVYYNYYQFMPLRTKSSIPASVYNGFLKNRGFGTDSVLYNTGESFVQAQNDYGVNALMVFAQACLESNYGTSYYAKSRNNLFGLGAYDSNPDNAFSFESVYECLELQMGYYLRNYFYANSSLFFGAHYGNKGSGISVKYASDPYYGQKISSIAYAIDKYANQNSGNLIEYNSRTVGVITTYEAKVYVTPGGTCTYTTEYRPGYQLNNTAAILAEEGDYYKIQADNYLKDNGYCLDVFVDSDVRTYDWNHNVGYISKSDVSIISSNTVIDPPEEELIKQGEVTVNVTNLRIRTAPTTASSFVGYAEEGKTYDVYGVTSADGYTWYQIGTNQYVADNGTWLTYRAEGETVPEKPVEPEKPSEPETPQIPEEEEEDVDTETYEIMSSLTSIRYEGKTAVHIEGRAFLVGIDCTDAGTVKHEIVVENLNDGTYTRIPAVTENASQPVNLFDGHTYTAVNYSGTIDLTELKDGDYALKIRVTNNGYRDERYIISNRIAALDPVENQDGTVTKVYPNSIYSNRFEISIDYDSIDYSTIVKPTSRYSARSVRNAVIENGKLVLDGYAYIYQASMREADHPEYQILLQNASGVIYSYDAQNQASKTDYAKIFNYDQPLDYADYTASIDLSDLPVGTYRMYIVIANDSYRDIEELYSYRFAEKLTGSLNGKNYTLSTSNVHGRFILEVTE